MICIRLQGWNVGEPVGLGRNSNAGFKQCSAVCLSGADII
jgi:hypothetical protein